MNTVRAAGFVEPLAISQKEIEDSPEFQDALWVIVNQAEPFNKHSAMRQIHGLAEKILSDRLFNRMYDAIYAHYEAKYPGDYETARVEAEDALADVEAMLRGHSFEKPMSDEELQEHIQTLVKEREERGASGRTAKRRKVIVKSAFRN